MTFSVEYSITKYSIATALIDTLAYFQNTAFEIQWARSGNTLFPVLSDTVGAEKRPLKCVINN